MTKTEDTTEEVKPERRALTTQSSSIKNLITALVKAQAQLRGAKKDTENPFFKSKYADLNSIWEAARGPLTENGLCVIQTTEIQEQDLGVKTILAHTSGEWISGFLPLTEKPQITGSALSYSRRYGLSAIIGGYTHDDDAEVATGPTRTKMHKDYEEPPPFEPNMGWTKTKR